MRRGGLALALLVAVPCIASPARAVPRYSARYRQDCSLCHYNPTGGGLRSLYASQYLLPAEMAFKTFKPESLSIEPQLSKSVTIGTDVRTLHLYSDPKQPQKNFFEMQGDVYLAFQADDRFSAYVDRGQSGSLEVFGLGYVMPYHGYFKVGRFWPEFGWKFDDHTHFARDIFAFQPPGQTDQGVEVGLFPGRLALAVSALNGNPGGSSFDTNDALAYAGRALYRCKVGPIGLGLGGSYWNNLAKDGKQVAGGPLGYVNWGDLSWVGEVDWSRFDPPGAPVSVTQLVTSNELSYQIVRGWDLLAIYDYADPNLDLQSGTRQRIGGGVSVLANPFFGVQATLDAFRFQRGPDVTAANYTQSQVQLHFYY